MTAENVEPAFFVVGCSRSGTTLLQALLDGHPHLAIPPESQLYSRFGPVFRTYGSLEQRSNRLRLIRDLLRDGYVRQWRLDAGAADVEARLKGHDRGSVVRALFELYAERRGAKRWGDKTPEHIRHLPMIRQDFPGARLIHLVRDGRDVAEAMRRMVFGPVTAFGLAQEWRREIMHWQRFIEEHGHEGTLVARYEDLVREPRETLARILEFLGEPFIDTVSSYATTPLTRTLATKQSAWHSSLGQGISASKVGAYRHKLAPRDIEIFEAVAGDLLSAYGYSLDLSAPRPPTWRERQIARVADRGVRWARKLAHPRVVWDEIQLRSRVAARTVSTLSGAIGKASH